MLARVIGEVRQKCFALLLIELEWYTSRLGATVVDGSVVTVFVTSRVQNQLVDKKSMLSNSLIVVPYDLIHTMPQRAREYCFVERKCIALHCARSMQS